MIEGKPSFSELARERFTAEATRTGRPVGDIAREYFSVGPSNSDLVKAVENVVHQGLNITPDALVEGYLAPRTREPFQTTRQERAARLLADIDLPDLG